MRCGLPPRHPGAGARGGGPERGGTASRSHGRPGDQRRRTAQTASADRTPTAAPTARIASAPAGEEDGWTLVPRGRAGRPHPGPGDPPNREASPHRTGRGWWKGWRARKCTWPTRTGFRRPDPERSGRPGRGAGSPRRSCRWCRSGRARRRGRDSSPPVRAPSRASSTPGAAPELERVADEEIPGATGALLPLAGRGWTEGGVRGPREDPWRRRGWRPSRGPRGTDVPREMGAHRTTRRGPRGGGSGGWGRSGRAAPSGAPFPRRAGPGPAPPPPGGSPTAPPRSSRGAPR